MIKRKIFSILFLVSILIGTVACNKAKTKETGVKMSDNPKTGVMEKSDVSGTPSTWIAENEKYGIHLPELEVFRQELEYLIYWKHWSDIDSEEFDCIYAELKRCKALDKDVKLQLYYREENYRETDYLESNYYSVVLVAPEYHWRTSLCYNSRGLTSDIGDFDTVPKRGFEKSKAGRGYNKYGEIVIQIQKERAASFLPVEQEDKEKNQIIKQIKKEVKGYCGKGANCNIYIQDFLPGSDRLFGYVIYHDTDSEYYMPYSWIHSEMLYSGRKMEKFELLLWWTRPTTAFNGGGYSRKAAKLMAQGQEEDVRADKCLLAYHIEGDKISIISGRE